MKRVLVVSLVFLPFVAFATDIATFMGRVNKYLLNPLILLLFVLAVLLFIVGLVQFLANTGSEEGRATGKQHMIWGLVGILIMASVFGIMKLLINSFSLKGPPKTINLKVSNQEGQEVQLPGKVK